jgi:hypothetical protein
MPKRIQRKRTKGWKWPDGAIYVGRPTIYGNPFKVGCNPPQFGTSLPCRCRNAKEAVDAFRYYAKLKAKLFPEWIKPLRGHDLACWCKLGDPCHADVLLEIANGGGDEK